MGREGPKLSGKQKAFADNYIKTLDGTQSYIDAKYKCKNRNVAKSAAARLLTNVNVKNYIEERLKKTEISRIADADEVLEYLTNVLRGNIKEEEIKVLGSESGAYIEKVKREAKISDRTKAAELLGKRYAIYSDKIEMTLKQVVFSGEDEIED